LNLLAAIGKPIKTADERFNEKSMKGSEKGEREVGHKYMGRSGKGRSMTHLGQASRSRTTLHIEPNDPFR
jgi:hypothetical protein